MLKRFARCCMLLCLAVTAQASAACGELTVAFYEHGALYHVDANGVASGIDIEIIDELAKRTGCRFRQVHESRVRIWAMLEAGKLDMSVSGIPTPERGKFARFVPYVGTHNYILMDRATADSVPSLDAFLADSRLRLGIVKSFRHGPVLDAWIEKLRAQGRVYETSDFTGLVNLFKIGRVHAMPAQPPSWAIVFKQEMADNAIRAMDWAPNDIIIGALILSRARVPLETIRAMRDDGTLEAIYKRHVGMQIAPGMLNYQGR